MAPRVTIQSLDSCVEPMMTDFINDWATHFGHEDEAYTRQHRPHDRNNTHERPEDEGRFAEEGGAADEE